MVMDGATIDFFPLPLSPLQPPFPRLLLYLPLSRSSNALIAAGNRGLSQHERSMNSRPLMFSTFYLPLIRGFLSPSLACCFLRYFCAHVCLLVSLFFPLNLFRNSSRSESIYSIIDNSLNRRSQGTSSDVCISLGIINWHYFPFNRIVLIPIFFIISNFSSVAHMRKDHRQKRLREESRKHDAKPRTLSAFRGLGMYGRSRRKPR